MCVYIYFGIVIDSFSHVLRNQKCKNACKNGCLFVKVSERYFTEKLKLVGINFPFY